MRIKNMNPKTIATWWLKELYNPFARYDDVAEELNRLRFIDYGVEIIESDDPKLWHDSFGDVPCIYEQVWAIREKLA